MCVCVCVCVCVCGFHAELTGLNFTADSVTLEKEKEEDNEGQESLVAGNILIWVSLRDKFSSRAGAIF